MYGKEKLNECTIRLNGLKKFRDEIFKPVHIQNSKTFNRLNISDKLNDEEKNLRAAIEKLDCNIERLEKSIKDDEYIGATLAADNADKCRHEIKKLIEQIDWGNE